MSNRASYQRIPNIALGRKTSKGEVLEQIDKAMEALEKFQAQRSGRINSQDQHLLAQAKQQLSNARRGVRISIIT